MSNTANEAKELKMLRDHQVDMYAAVVKNAGAPEAKKGDMRNLLTLGPGFTEVRIRGAAPKATDALTTVAKAVHEGDMSDDFGKMGGAGGAGEVTAIDHYRTAAERVRELLYNRTDEKTGEIRVGMLATLPATTRGTVAAAAKAKGWEHNFLPRVNTLFAAGEGLRKYHLNMEAFESTDEPVIPYANDLRTGVAARDEGKDARADRQAKAAAAADGRQPAAKRTAEKLKEHASKPTRRGGKA